MPNPWSKEEQDRINGIGTTAMSVRSGEARESVCSHEEEAPQHSGIGADAMRQQEEAMRAEAEAAIKGDMPTTLYSPGESAVEAERRFNESLKAEHFRAIANRELPDLGDVDMDGFSRRAMKLLAEEKGIELPPEEEAPAEPTEELPEPAEEGDALDTEKKVEVAETTVELLRGGVEQLMDIVQDLGDSAEEAMDLKTEENFEMAEDMEAGTLPGEDTAAIEKPAVAAGKVKAAFMKPEIYEGDAYIVDGPHGTTVIPVELAAVVGGDDIENGEKINKDDARFEGLREELAVYTEGVEFREVWEIERKHGWLGRYSAPGYMDSTEWGLYDTAEEAKEELDRLYGDDEPEMAPRAVKALRAYASMHRRIDDADFAKVCAGLGVKVEAAKKVMAANYGKGEPNGALYHKIKDFVRNLIKDKEQAKVSWQDDKESIYSEVADFVTEENGATEPNMPWVKRMTDHALRNLGTAASKTTAINVASDDRTVRIMHYLNRNKEKLGIPAPTMDEMREGKMPSMSLGEVKEFLQNHPIAKEGDSEVANRQQDRLMDAIDSLMQSDPDVFFGYYSMHENDQPSWGIFDGQKWQRKDGKVTMKRHFGPDEDKTTASLRKDYMALTAQKMPHAEAIKVVASLYGMDEKKAEMRVKAPMRPKAGGGAGIIFKITEIDRIKVVAKKVGDDFVIEPLGGFGNAITQFDARGYDDGSEKVENDGILLIEDVKIALHDDGKRELAERLKDAEDGDEFHGEAMMTQYDDNPTCRIFFGWVRGKVAAGFNLNFEPAQWSLDLQDENGIYFGPDDGVKVSIKAVVTEDGADWYNSVFNAEPDDGGIEAEGKKRAKGKKDDDDKDDVTKFGATAAKPGPITLQENPNKAFLQERPNYKIFFDGIPAGEAYFNMRGYVVDNGLWIPFEDGNVVSLQIGEVSVSGLKREISKANAEWNAAGPEAIANAKKEIAEKIKKYRKLGAARVRAMKAKAQRGGERNRPFRGTAGAEKWSDGKGNRIVQSSDKSLDIEYGTHSDRATRHDDGTIVYDFPERIPAEIKRKVEQIFKTMKPTAAKDNPYQREGDLTLEQRKAIEAYAKEHGRNWKRDLAEEWMNGTTILGPLQQIRNEFGPTWLKGFVLPMKDLTAAYKPTAKRFVQHVFTQDSQDYAEFEKVLDDEGEDAALDYALSLVDFTDEKYRDVVEKEDIYKIAGTTDKVVSKDDGEGGKYWLVYNPRIGYFGISHELAPTAATARRSARAGVGETILQQLGGNKFLAMTGAHVQSTTENMLAVKFPKAKDGINALAVYYDEGKDTYRMRFISQKGAPTMAVKDVAVVDDVYAEDLRRIFTDHTGLETSLGTMRGQKTTAMDTDAEDYNARVVQIGEKIGASKDVIDKALANDADAAETLRRKARSWFGNLPEAEEAGSKSDFDFIMNFTARVAKGKWEDRYYDNERKKTPWMYAASQKARADNRASIDELREIQNWFAKNPIAQMAPETYATMKDEVKAKADRMSELMAGLYEMVPKPAATAGHRGKATGEANQEYDHEIFDKIVADLEAAGFPGATHKEFDKYQGVYIRVPRVGKFWNTGYYVVGKPKEDKAKYRKAYLVDTRTGEQYSASRGDYFNMPDNKQLMGNTLVLIMRDGTRKTIDNPKKSDLPDLGDVNSSVTYEGKPTDVYVFQSEQTQDEVEVIGDNTAGFIAMVQEEAANKGGGTTASKKKPSGIDVRQSKGKWEVVDRKDNDKVLGTHDSEEKAREQQKAIYASMNAKAAAKNVGKEDIPEGWIGNYESKEEADDVTKKMNALSDTNFKSPMVDRQNNKDYGFMQVGKYTYSVGDAIFTPDIKFDGMENWAGLYRELRPEFKPKTTAAANPVDIGDGYYVHKIGYDRNGNWAVWVSKGSNPSLKIQTNGDAPEAHRARGKYRDLADAVKSLPDKARDELKEYHRRFAPKATKEGGAAKPPFPANE